MHNLLHPKNIVKIFEKYNISPIIDFSNKDILFIELCKIQNIEKHYIKNCIFYNYDLDYEYLDNNHLRAYDYIQKYFINSNNETIKESILLLKLFIPNISKNDKYILISHINDKINEFSNNKIIYSSLKAFLIYVKKKIL